MPDHKVRLLLVEDDKVDQMAFERFVKNRNLPYAYTIAGSVAQAKEILKSTCFDLIISDYLLGDGTSFELFDLYNGTPVIITTGSGDEDVAVQAMKLGACDYIIKDPDGNYLIILPVTVDLALKRKQNEDLLHKHQEHLEAMVTERTAKLQAEIAERQRVEEELRNSKEYVQRLIASSNDCIKVLDLDGNLVSMSAGGQKLLEIDDISPYLNTCWVDFWQGKDRIAAAAAVEKAKQGQKGIFSGYCETEKKTPKWWEIVITPINDTNGNLQQLLAISRDITERIQAEALRDDLEAQLAQKHKIEALGMMAGGMAHNFNNNLAIILGGLDLTRIKLPSNSEVIPLLDNAKIAVLRSRDLIQNILSYSRQGVLNREAVQMALVVEETLKLLRSTIPTTVKINYDHDAKCHDLTIQADATRIQEALINLCNNAIHAMDERGELTILLKAVNLQARDIPVQYQCPPGSYLLLSVQDNGCGMTEDLIEKIFDPFFTTKTVDQGTGMGLATLQGMVIQHGGLIKVHSTPGQGSTFEIYLPISDTEQPALSPTDTTLPHGAEKILFIDDDEMLASLGKLLLTELGYQVCAMTSSSESLKLFQADPDHFDLIITDQTMPDITGQELILELRKIRPNLPAILCTGYSSKVDENLAQQLELNAFLMKPLELSKFAQTVRKVLDEVDREKKV
jgi:PAS domain S-box-containing protein